MQALLGLPLALAQEKLRAAGMDAEAVVSRSPRRTADEGTPRVVRAQKGLLTVCYFPDGDPEETKAGTDAPADAALS